MNWFDRWMFERIVWKQVKQGYDHDERIIEMYDTIRYACHDEFIEDSCITLNRNLTEWFNISKEKEI
jgi:hypothetical protein